MKINRASDTNLKLTRVRSVPILRIHGMLPRKGSTANRRLPSAPCLEWTVTSGGGSSVRQYILLGDSLNVDR